MKRRIVKEVGKRVTKIFLVSGLALGLILEPMKQDVLAGNWLDKWYNDVMSSSSGVDYFSTQQRGYITFGSFGLRLPTKAEYLFSIEKPYLRVGCGGIDMFMGGFSFLNPDYLVQKVQAMLQAAPFIAFDIALSTLWPEGASILKKAEMIIDMLNQIQISECGISVPQSVVNLATNPEKFFSLQGEKEAERQQRAGITDLWKSFWSKMVRVTPDGSTIDNADAGSAKRGLSPYIQNWLNGPENVGFLDYLVSTGRVDRDVADIFKAYIGDLRFSKNSQGVIYNFKTDQGCSEAHIKDAFEKGTLYVKRNNSCVVEDATQIINDVQKALTDAYTNMLSGTPLNTKFVNLVKNSPSPLYHLVKYAVLTRNPGFLESYAPIFAKTIFYAGLLDLSKKMKGVFKNLAYYYESGENADPSGKEKKIALNAAIKILEDRLEEFDKKVTQLYHANQAEVLKAINEALTTMQFLYHVEKTLNINVSGVLAYTSGGR